MACHITVYGVFAMAASQRGRLAVYAYDTLQLLAKS
jgi:hypothetical protein